MNDELKIRKIDDEGWYWSNNDFIARYKGYLRPVCISVYAVLCYHANNLTQTCYPSEETIALEAGTTSRTVRKYLYLLKELSVILIEKGELQYGKRQNNVYTLLHKKHWKRPEDTISYGKNDLFLSPKEIKRKNQRTQFPTNQTDIIKKVYNDKKALAENFSPGKNNSE